ELELRYYRGWEEGRSYAEVLRASIERDLRYGATQAGPQRADILIRIGGRPALEVLSRGQQKLLVAALKIAQGRMLLETTGRKSIYLVDDLPSELDGEKRRKLCLLLSTLQTQIFMSAVQSAELHGSDFQGAFPKTFQLE